MIHRPVATSLISSLRPGSFIKMNNPPGKVPDKIFYASSMTAPASMIPAHEKKLRQGQKPLDADADHKEQTVKAPGAKTNSNAKSKVAGHKVTKESQKLREKDEKLELKLKESAKVEEFVDASPGPLDLSPDGIIVEEDIDNNLPPTTILLHTGNGSKVYVVGTLHFSVESQNDVAKVIRSVQPDIIVLELCRSRAFTLAWTEEQILSEAQNLNFRMMREVLRDSGIVQGGVYLLLLWTTVKIIKQVGVAPGGEFRTAYRESLAVPNCRIEFGDRPIELTLKRMAATLSVWRIMRLVFALLFSDVSISKEEMEQYKDKDLIERMILGLYREFPECAKVLIEERDQFLAYSLQVVADGGRPNKVVGVVGMGHVSGIKENWTKISLESIEEVLRIPPPKTSTKIIKFTLKFTAIGLALYGIHRLASKSELYTNLFRYLGLGYGADEFIDD